MITLSKKSVVIYVAGQRFSLCTEDTEEYVIQIGEKVDTLIRGAQKDNPRLNRDGCATLVALSLCDDETKLSKRVEALRLQIKDYLEENERLNKEVEELKAKLELALTKETVKKEEPQTAPEEAKAEAPSETAKAPEEKPAPSHRQTAFVGKNFPSKDHGKKKGHHNHNNSNSNNQNKNSQPAPYYKKDTDAQEIPEPMQFSIFDTDFI